MGRRYFYHRGGVYVSRLWSTNLIFNLTDSVVYQDAKIDAKLVASQLVHL